MSHARALRCSCWLPDSATDAAKPGKPRRQGSWFGKQPAGEASAYQASASYWERAGVPVLQAVPNAAARLGHLFGLAISASHSGCLHGAFCLIGASSVWMGSALLPCFALSWQNLICVA